LLCRERLFAFDDCNAVVTVRAWIWEDPAIHMKSLFLLILALTFCSAALAQPNSPDGLTYKSGYSSIMKLGKDLYSALPKSEKEFVSPQPISIETDVTPFIRLLYFPDEPKPVRGVWISAGFIDLVNNISHAKAIDGIEKNYFNRYIEILSLETGEKSLRPLPNDTKAAYWTDDMLNEQLSNFNSIVGIVVGNKLAHHYLGHYDKYKDKLSDGKGNPVPINNVITPQEWEEAFLKGVRNALEAGCTVEGAIPFYEAFDKMKQRPPWTAYFIPANLKFAKLKKQLEKVQRDFFNK
jgi:hypothetical protein